MTVCGSNLLPSDRMTLSASNDGMDYIVSEITVAPGWKHGWRTHQGRSTGS